jgi:predicted O-methyltransferase YrrM
MNTLPAIITQAFQSGSLLDEHGNAVPLDSNISLEEATELYQTVRHLAPSASAEVGLAKGISSLTICAALGDAGQGHHHVMDPFQSNYGNTGLAMLKRAGHEGRFTFYRKFAEEVFPTLPELDFVFIDASHLFDLTLMEFVLADKKLRVGGLIGFHDLWMPSLRSVLRFILENRSFELVPHTRAATSHLSWKGRLSRTLRHLPKAKRIFSSLLLNLDREASLANLTFVRKLDHDHRDWRHFAEF